MSIQYTREPCGWCPVQAEGTVDGAWFYFRARGDCALYLDDHGPPYDDEGPYREPRWCVPLEVEALKTDAQRMSSDYFGYLETDIAHDLICIGVEKWRQDPDRFDRYAPSGGEE